MNHLVWLFLFSRCITVARKLHLKSAAYALLVCIATNKETRICKDVIILTPNSFTEEVFVSYSSVWYIFKMNI